MWRQFMFLLEDLPTVMGAAGDAVTDAVGDAAAATADVVNNTTATDPGNLFGSIWIWVIYAIIIFGAYFLLMRPQRKREKKIKEMQSSIKTGDNVMTAGGMFGRVADVGEDCFIIEFGTNRGIRIPVQKSDVLGIRSPKTTPAPKDAIEQKD